MDSQEGGFKFEKEPQQSAEDVFKAAMQALAVLASAGFIHIDQAKLVKEMIRELLHWAYAKPGTHGTPAEVFRVMIANTKKEMSTAEDLADLAGPFPETPFDKKRSRTND